MIRAHVQGMNVRYYLEEMLMICKYCIRDKTHVAIDFDCEGCTMCEEVK